MFSLINAPFTLQTTFDNGVLRLTTHRLIWDDEEQEVLIRKVFRCVLSFDSLLFLFNLVTHIGKDFGLGSKSNH